MMINEVSVAQHSGGGRPIHYILHGMALRKEGKGIGTKLKSERVLSGRYPRELRQRRGMAVTKGWSLSDSIAD